MKKTALLGLLVLIVSCKKESTESFGKSNTKKTPVELGKELFEDKGNCVACHQPNQKVIGPSIQDIAKIYKAKNASIVTFLQGNADPIVDPSQFEVMKTNFAITKSMSEDELKAIEAYIYSNLK
ncbi:c-type cytochrome [Flavobacterium sp.]|uniref:c-type cytochrome n=1 Tax=Flavobacterium sp. TaxID=239 RepID=UPI00286CA587|nr:c-type cytochrome [Flavobacterium sp.]